MKYIKQNWVFYFVDEYGRNVITHVGKYVKPKQTKHWRLLENMKNVKTIGIELNNNFIE